MVEYMYMYVSYQILCWWIQCVSALQVFNKSLLVCLSSASCVCKSNNCSLPASLSYSQGVH